MSLNPSLTCWILTEEKKVGAEHQCRGLVDALHLVPQVKYCTARFPWNKISARFWPPSFHTLKRASSFSPPWPDILIACGRASFKPAALIKKASGDKTFTIAIQNPRLNLSAFDLVVVPFHDRLKGPNIFHTIGAPHRITPSSLQREATKFLPQFSHLPRPWVSIILGGSSARCRFDVLVVETFVQQLKELHHLQGGSFLITPSRRTAPEVIQAFKENLESIPHYFWDREGENPYTALIALGDFIVVTWDSVSMISEAAISSKPLYLYPLPRRSKKHEPFYQKMLDSGYCRIFSLPFETWKKEPFFEMPLIAQKVVGMYREREASAFHTL